MATTTRARLRLRYIVWPADFRYSIETLFADVPQTVRRELRGNDAIAFVSGGEDQIAFAYQAITVGMTRGTSAYDSRRRVLSCSLRLRLSPGRFNPAMIANYAGDLGIELVGLKRFEERYREQLAERRAAAA